MFQLLTTKRFWIHVGLALLSALVLFWILFKLMSVYTHHGETFKVPLFVGKKISELESVIAENPVKFEIIDSVYAPKEPPGVVIRQDPDTGILVKQNRTIYLYVTTVIPPQIQMPNLVDRSLRQATSMIGTYGLKLKRVIETNDPCDNCVLKQLCEGKEVKPGDYIKKGSAIELVVGSGSSGLSSSGTNTFPIQIGMNFCEARNALKAGGFSIVSVKASVAVTDSCTLVIEEFESDGANGLRLVIGE